MYVLKLALVCRGRASSAPRETERQRARSLSLLLSLSLSLSLARALALSLFQRNRHRSATLLMFFPFSRKNGLAHAQRADGHEERRKPKEEAEEEVFSEVSCSSEECLREKEGKWLLFERDKSVFSSWDEEGRGGGHTKERHTPDTHPPTSSGGAPLFFVRKRFVKRFSNRWPTDTAQRKPVIISHC